MELHMNSKKNSQGMFNLTEQLKNLNSTISEEDDDDEGFTY